jgi:hypothetical protein
VSLSHNEYSSGLLEPGNYLVLFVPERDDARDGFFGVGPRLRVYEGAIERSFRLPLISVSGHTYSDMSGDARVVAVPSPLPAGAARTLIESEDYSELFGSCIESDGSFQVKNLDVGSYSLQIRSRGRVLASQEIEVRCDINMGSWQFDRE